MPVLQKALWRFLFGPVGRLLPFGACRILARPVAWIAWILGVRRKVTLKNLRMAFPELPELQLQAVALRTYRSLCTVFLELPSLRYLSDRRWKQLFQFENEELLRTIDHRGALLLSGHLGNWEMLAIAAGMRVDAGITVVVKEQRDYGTLAPMRTAHGNRLVPTRRAAREASSLLGSGGGVLALLADQSTGSEDHLTTMFGLPTYTFSAPARLALRYRPRVITGFAVRQPDGSYIARLHEIPHDDLPDTPEAAQTLTQRYVDLLEQAVRDHPESWLWTHRKWKHTPGVNYES